MAEHVAPDLAEDAIPAAATTKSARRALEILEFFATEHRPATVAELAATLNYPQSSTSVLLKELARLGYLERRAGDRSFSPTLRVMLLGAWLQDRLIGRGNLLGLMQDLRHRTNCTVLVGMQRGVQVQYILALRRRRGNDRLRSGLLRPICHAAIGRALVMVKPRSEIELMVRRANAGNKDPALHVVPADFLAEMAESRKRGWAGSSGRIGHGVGVLAMPLPPLAEHPALALGLGGPTVTLNRQRDVLIGEMRAVCEALKAAPDAPDLVPPEG